MKKSHKVKNWLIGDLVCLFFLLICALMLSGCTAETGQDETSTSAGKEDTVMTGQGFDGTYKKEEGREVIYLAGGYCHIPVHEIDDVAALIAAEESYEKPSQEQLRKMLTAEQYAVTQNGDTEKPYTNEYCETFEEGIYVDVSTGQPLFRSADKYQGSCGWPSFSAPIYEGVLRYSEDTSHGMARTEVRSGVGDAHLGHIFTDDPESPNGVRYCINSAALRFIPKAEMEAQGYGAYLILMND